MLKEFPIQDTRLRRLLQTILDHEPEAYAELIHVSLTQINYGANHQEEKPVLQDDPILLEDLLTVDEERSRAGLTPPTSATVRPKVSDVRSVPSLPVRLSPSRRKLPRRRPSLARRSKSI